MAAKSLLYFFSFILLISSQAEGSNLAMVSSILTNKGYHAMSLTLDDMFFNTLHIDLTINSTLTLFCPPDHAFFSSKLYSQPPLTLLQYHLVPSKLNRDYLVSLPHGSKVETLFHGHSLIITTLPSSEYVSLDEVKVSDWNVYNDGHLVIHGVDDFFDLGFQTLRYPDVQGTQTKVDSGISCFKKLAENWINLLPSLTVIVLNLLVLSYFCIRYSHGDNHYVSVQQDVDV